MANRVQQKMQVRELAVLGGKPLFDVPISTSNLVQPAFDNFLDYSKIFFDKHQYTNNGGLVKLLEQRLASFHESEYCITFCSGFWGLVLAIKTMALEGKTEIVMPSFTYRRMADIAAWCRLKPRFCEVERDSLALNYDTVSECITAETALIMAVHPIVNCCDVLGIEKLAEETGIPVLFDGVESTYESIPGGKIGGFGNAECFSMHASKLLNGFEGGYVTTNNSRLAEKLQALRSFGFQGKDNLVISNGLNAKLNEIHAAMALANLDEMGAQITKNKQNYRRYQEKIVGISGLRLLEFDESCNSSFKNIIVECLDDWPFSRDRTVEILNAENILARAYYSPPLHQKKMMYPHVSSNLAITDSLALRFILLPCGDFVDEDDIDEVIGLLGFMVFNQVEISSCSSLGEGGE